MIEIIYGEINDYIKDVSFEYEILSYKNNDINTIFTKYYSISLFDQKKLFIVDGANFLVNKSDKLKKKEQETFNHICSAGSDNKLVFLISKELNQTIDIVKNNINNIKYTKITENDVLYEYIKKEKINIKKESLDYIINNIDRTYNIKKELLKLKYLKNENNTYEELLKEQINLKSEVNIFIFIEQLILNKKKKAYDIYLDKIKYSEYKQEQILAIMGSQIKVLLQIKILFESLTPIKIADRLGINVYRVKSGLKITEKITYKEIADFYSKINKYDSEIKHGKTNEENIIYNFLI